MPIQSRHGGKRVNCCVPFCRHTRGDRKNDPLPADIGTYEWICGEHWRPVSRATKRAKRKWERLDADDVFIRASKRRLERFGYLASDQWGGLRSYVNARAWRAWEHCKAEAIEVALGIRG